MFICPHARPLFAPIARTQDARIIAPCAVLIITSEKILETYSHGNSKTIIKKNLTCYECFPLDRYYIEDVGREEREEEV